MLRKLVSWTSLTLFLFSIFFATVTAVAEEPTVCAVYFTKTGCSHCASADLFVLATLPQYEGKFVVIEYEIQRAENAVVLAEYNATYGCSIAVPLVIFGKDDFLVGDSLILANLTSRIDEHLALGNKLPLANGSSVAFEDLDVEDLPGSPSVWFGNNSPPEIPTILAILTAAVVDSVNPCEFAVLVILLSGVIASGGRKKALKTGLAFIFAVFVMYLLMGFGLFSISMAPGIAYYFYKAVGVFALIVGVLNMKDYFWESTRGVLSSIPESWRPRIQKLLDDITSVPGALVSGFLVSIFLLPCTSAPYIVALSLLAHEATKIWAVALLFLYNFIFILPMVGIVLAVYFGLTTTAKAAHWRHKRLGLLHLIAGAIIFCMGVWMLFFY